MHARKRVQIIEGRSPPPEEEERNPVTAPEVDLLMAAMAAPYLTADIIQIYPPWLLSAKVHSKMPPQF